MATLSSFRIDKSSSSISSRRGLPPLSPNPLPTRPRRSGWLAARAWLVSLSCSEATEVIVQGPGEALRVAAEDLRRIVMARRQVQDCLLLYVQAFLVQVSQTAAANARFSARQRLARWLLMAHDRMTGDQLPLTHEYLALMLGTRRATVSTLIPELESLGAIRNRRGRVVLLDRSKLEEVAGPSYGTPEREYGRLIARTKGWGTEAPK